MGDASRGFCAGGRSQDVFEGMPSDWTCEEKTTPDGIIYLTASDAREFLSRQRRKAAKTDDS